ncbi:hypothetical protein I2494_08645 [Budviciaceae bacterium BWR-B9]|uniref:Uncharacterized protein n=1 Tax=Limnobaculum allomyrinae TaxID=2791986 RepID=A0ABS1IPU1_9GAMM|nr:MULTISPECIES: hypothetical protein [Limnobaculum]MBK5143783.1 hypothetical protein [Limnobaculum allomyrinae]MBV7693522.1 hypothetical protein [Limnobaculum sp. M2-1]
MALSTDEQIALLTDLTNQNVITEQERRKAIACLLSGTTNSFDSESSAITWLLNNKIIGTPPEEKPAEITPPPTNSSATVTQAENRISPQQQQHVDLLTQLHNINFINDQQFVDARALLLSRNNLKFNTSYHLFLWLVEQGIAQEQADHSAALRSIQQEADKPVVVQQAPPGSINQPKKKSGFIKSKLLPFIIFFVFISWVNKCSHMGNSTSVPQSSEAVAPLPVADIPPASATPSVHSEQSTVPTSERVVVAANCDHPMIVQSVLRALTKHYQEKHPYDKVPQLSAGKIIQTNKPNAFRLCNMRIVPSDGESISYQLKPGNDVKSDVTMTISSFHGYDE